MHLTLETSPMSCTIPSLPINKRRKILKRGGGQTKNLGETRRKNRGKHREQGAKILRNRGESLHRENERKTREKFRQREGNDRT